MYINILDYLEKTESLLPNKIAFVDKNKSITFKQLKENSQKIATQILNYTCADINKPIAVYLNKNVESIAALLGIVYSGNYYTPLDTKSPVKRVKQIIDVLNPEIIITDEENEKKLKEMNVVAKVVLIGETETLTINSLSLDRIQRIKIDTDPLYVLFTSGSTGVPKGVIINHKSVIDYIEWVSETFNINEEDIFGNQAPFYFDNSILDIYCTLKNGSTMVIIPEEFFVFPQKLLKFINEEKINTIFWVPSALIGVANSGFLEKIKLSINKVLFCGEVMPTKQLNTWIRNNPKALYANLYGPTEITDVCAYYIINRNFEDNEQLPIGYPCRNTDLIVLDENNKKVGINEIGELCVRGTSLSLGYYKDFEKTDSSFVQNPLNKIYNEKIYKTGDLVKYNDYGELVYINRKDFQIKHMGHRIELGEIESATFSISNVKQCCALYNQDKKIINLFCVVDNLEEKQIYKRLSDLVPKYMLPSKITIIDKMPINHNGKIDRISLKKRYMEE